MAILLVALGRDTALPNQQNDNHLLNLNLIKCFYLVLRFNDKSTYFWMPKFGLNFHKEDSNVYFQSHFSPFHLYFSPSTITYSQTLKADIRIIIMYFTEIVQFVEY